MPKEVTIIVGAKDQASKVLQNVSKSTKTLGKNVQATARQTASATNSMNTAFKGLKTTLGPLLAAFAAVKTATAGFRFLSDSAAAFDTQTAAVNGLTKAIELSGNTLGPTIEQHEAFASALQGTVNVGDEVTLGLMKQASMLGVSNDKLQAVTQTAIGMSEATGASLEDSMRKVNETINGNTEAFAEFLPQLRNAATDSERLAIIQKTAANGLQMQAAGATSAAGSAQRLANSWGDFLEVIGEALAPVRAFISTGLAVLVETIQTAVVPALKSIMPSAETVKNAMAQMKVGIVSAVTLAEVVIGNFGQVWEMLKTKVMLYVTGIVEDVKHAFTVSIPAYAAWFGENFTTMISDVFFGAVTIIKNSVTNMGEIMKKLWDFVKSGFKGGPEALFADISAAASKNLFEGFEAQTKALPQVMARNLTAGEQAMMAKIGGIAGNLGDEYKKKLAARLGGDKSKGGLLGQLALGGVGGGEDGAADAIAEAIGGGAAKVARAQDLSAKESRLLTRGRAEKAPEQMVKLLESISDSVKETAENTAQEDDIVEDSLSVTVVD